MEGENLQVNSGVIREGFLEEVTLEQSLRLHHQWELHKEKEWCPCGI